MRVLICDQESEMLERIAREFEVDVATSKATCIDLMRANPFDVVVASERLVDGSGLELLSSIATRWPDTLRVLAIEPERRKMLGGKLAPFRLHATIRYPIDEDELERRLNELDRLLGESEEDYADEDEPAPAPRGRAPSPPQRPASTASTRPPVSSTQGRSTYTPTVTGARPSAPAGRPPNVAGRSTPVGNSLSRQAPATAPPKGAKGGAHQVVRGKSYYSSASRAAAELAPPLVRRKPGSYTPLPVRAAGSWHRTLPPDGGWPQG
jgi:hypothetical protein